MNENKKKHAVFVKQLMPPQRPCFRKLTLIFDLDLDWWPWTWFQQKGLVTWYTHVKYKGPKSYQSKEMVNVKKIADKQEGRMDQWTNARAKTICPRSIDAGSIKKAFTVMSKQAFQEYWMQYQVHYRYFTPRHQPKTNTIRSSVL